MDGYTGGGGGAEDNLVRGGYFAGQTYPRKPQSLRCLTHTPHCQSPRISPGGNVATFFKHESFPRNHPPVPRTRYTPKCHGGAVKCNAEASRRATEEHQTTTNHHEPPRTTTNHHEPPRTTTKKGTGGVTKATEEHRTWTPAGMRYGGTAPWPVHLGCIVGRQRPSAEYGSRAPAKAQAHQPPGVLTPVPTQRQKSLQHPVPCMSYHPRVVSLQPKSRIFCGGTRHWLAGGAGVPAGQRTRGSTRGPGVRGEGGLPRRPATGFSSSLETGCQFTAVGG